MKVKLRLEIDLSNAAGSASATAPEPTQVMNAGIQELPSTFRQQNIFVVGATGTMAVSAPAGDVVASAPDVTRVDGQKALSAPMPSPNVAIDAMTVFLAIMWILTIALPPVVVLTLPVTAQSIIAGYVAAVGLTLIVHWRVTDKRKR